MVNIRKIVVGLFALLIMVAGPTALAAPSSTTETSHTVTPVSWSLESAANGGCPQLATSITGSGDLVSHITITHFPDGSRQIVDVSTSDGFAYDPNGKQYRYQYRNRAVISVPAQGALVIVEDTDSFALRGGDPANRVRASFHWIWTYEPASLDAVGGFMTVGIPTLDPNAGNWVQLKSVGDPLLCDPI